MTFTGRFGGIVLSETQSVLNAAGAVSYTHLDVYKRQEVWGSEV